MNGITLSPILKARVSSLPDFALAAAAGWREQHVRSELHLGRPSGHGYVASTGKFIIFARAGQRGLERMGLRKFHTGA